MYKVYADDEILYYPGDKEYCLLEGTVKLAINQAGSFECLIPETNPLYNSIDCRKTMLSVYRDDKLIFNGEVRESEKDKNKNKRVYAVGELSFLLDTVQPQHDYGAVTPTSFITSLLSTHNDMVETRKEYSVGTISVTTGSDNSHKVTDYDKTLDALRGQLIERFGGCLKARWYNGTRYLDYVELNDYGEANHQGINFGENLLDYSENLTASDIVTCVIPRGARINSDDDFEKRVDIKSVNNGKEYITASSTVLNRFGYVWAVVEFNDIDTASALKTAAQQWLSENQYETMRLKVTAVDLSQLDSSIDDMNLGDRIPCHAEPYGLSMTIPIQEQTLNLMTPEKDTIVLGATLKNKQKSISTQVGQNEENIKTAVHTVSRNIETVIRQERDAIMSYFSGENGGYKLSEYDSNGLWIRDLYMDQPDKDDATNIIEISMRGIRYSNDGYGSPTDSCWNSAWSINGKFVSQEIFSQIIFATLIKTGRIENIPNPNDRTEGKCAFDLDEGSITTEENYLYSSWTDGWTGKLRIRSVYKDGELDGYFEVTNPNGSKTTQHCGYVYPAVVFQDRKSHLMLGALDEINFRIGEYNDPNRVDSWCTASEWIINQILRVATIKGASGSGANNPTNFPDGLYVTPDLWLNANGILQVTDIRGAHGVSGAKPDFHNGFTILGGKEGRTWTGNSQGQNPYVQIPTKINQQDGTVEEWITCKLRQGVLWDYITSD